MKRSFKFAFAITILALGGIPVTGCIAGGEPDLGEGAIEGSSIEEAANSEVGAPDQKLMAIDHEPQLEAEDASSDRTGMSAKLLRVTAPEGGDQAVGSPEAAGCSGPCPGWCEWNANSCMAKGKRTFWGNGNYLWDAAAGICYCHGFKTDTCC